MLIRIHSDKPLRYRTGDRFIMPERDASVDDRVVNKTIALCREINPGKDVVAVQAVYPDGTSEVVAAPAPIDVEIT